jgi:tRNA(adenine34) deaminase
MADDLKVWRDLADRWMPEALAEARKAREKDEVPVGCVVLSEAGLPIGKGHNLRELLQDPLAHAEAIAIREATRTAGSWRLEGATLIVTLEPCPMCLAACQQARIARVIYGAADPKGGAIALGYKLHEDVRTNHRFEVIRDDRFPECGSILSEFFRQKRAAAKGSAPDQTP